jgi:tetratricopeptide (TPR) repeat protein
MAKNEEIERRKYKTILDLGLKISVPFNNDINLIKQIIPLKSYIDSLYLPPHFSVFPFPASADKFKNYRTNWKDFKNDKKYNELLSYIISKLKQNNIKTRLILNSIVFDFQEILDRWPNSRLFKNLKYFCSNSDLEYVTVADLPLARRINSSFPSLKITMSTNAFINNFERLSYWLEHINNIEGVTLDIKINKNLEIIKDIKQASKLKITLINELCLTNCPYRETHTILNDLGLCQNHFEGISKYKMMPWLAYCSTALTPYNLRFYKGIIDYLKLVDRNSSTKTILFSLNHYIFNINSRKYVIAGRGSGEEPENIFQKVSTCDRHCDQCNYCYTAWRKLNRIPEDYIYLTKGFYYQIKGEYKKALVAYDKVKNKKYLSKLNRLKHDCHIRLKKYTRDIDAYKQAIRLASD